MKTSKYISLVTTGVVALMLSVVTVNTAQAEVINRAGMCHTKGDIVTGSKTDTNYRGTSASKARLMFNGMKQEYKGYTGKDRACVKLKEKWTKGVRKYTVTSRTFQVTKK